MGPLEAAMRQRLGSSAVCIISLVSLALGPPLRGAEPWGNPIAMGAWRLEAASASERWLIVHALPSDRDPNFHVEVLEASHGDPPWKFHWLAPHLAISEMALRRSILGPSRRRASYPETYSSAYQSWQRDRTGKVCTTTVAECLATPDNRRSGP
jgi:hypothetical protein